MVSHVSIITLMRTMLYVNCLLLQLIRDLRDTGWYCGRWQSPFSWCLALHSKHSKNEVTMVSLRQRSVIFATFLVACCGLGLLAGGLGTRYWVVAQAEKETSDKSSGFIHFGLFEGTKKLNHGFGERPFPMNIVDILYRERTFMVKELWVGTIVCICVAMLFGIIAAFAAVVNTASNPVEPICHIPGKLAHF